VVGPSSPSIEPEKRFFFSFLLGPKSALARSLSYHLYIYIYIYIYIIFFWKNFSMPFWGFLQLVAVGFSYLSDVSY